LRRVARGHLGRGNQSPSSWPMEAPTHAVPATKMDCEVLVPNPPQLAQLIQRRFQAFDRSGVSLRATAPAQCLADLLQRNFPAHRPFQYVRSDLADSLRSLPVSLPMEELVFRLCHPRISAKVDGKDAIEIDRFQSVVKAGVIPMMAIFLSGRVLLRRESVARESAFQRAVPHGDLAGVAALEILPGPTQPLRRWQRMPFGRLFSTLHRIAQPRMSCSHPRSPADR